jgi:FkbM family methyltransferase
VLSFIRRLRSQWRHLAEISSQLERSNNLLHSIDQRFTDGGLVYEIRERAVHIEGKIDRLQESKDQEFRGSPDQRYGHLTYSQHGEDMVFIALFERMGIAHPTFLDIGANHPFKCSNTALLRDRCGSRGVNIDASPEVIELFKRDRPDDVNVNVGVAGKPGTLTFYRFDPTSGRNSFSKSAMEKMIESRPDLSIWDEIAVPVLTLDQVIDTYCGGTCPDLLSLDAEGFDYEIVEAASFASRPKILCVETFTSEGDDEKAMDELVTSKGFRKFIQMYANAIYVQESAKI